MPPSPINRRCGCLRKPFDLSRAWGAFFSCSPPLFPSFVVSLTRFPSSPLPLSAQVHLFFTNCSTPVSGAARKQKNTRCGARWPWRTQGRRSRVRWPALTICEPGPKLGAGSRRHQSPAGTQAPGRGREKKEKTQNCSRQSWVVARWGRLVKALQWDREVLSLIWYLVLSFELEEEWPEMRLTCSKEILC